MLVCLSAILTSTACGGGGSSTNCADSSFAATVKDGSNVTVRTLTGKACWSLTGSQDWALGLYAGEGVDAIVIGREFGGPPTRGTSYPLGASADPTAFGMRFLLQAYDNVWVCSPAGTGSLNVTTAFAAPLYGGFISAPLLCVERLGDRAIALDLQVTSFVATEGEVTLIP